MTTERLELGVDCACAVCGETIPAGSGAWWRVGVGVYCSEGCIPPIEWGVWTLKETNLLCEGKFVRSASSFEVELLQDLDRLRHEKNAALREIAKLKGETP
jgi:hypothetical protein